MLFEVNGDSLIYGGLAKNLLLHGRYALTLPSGEMYPTLIRLPGYPLFLAVCFRLFGMENYFAAACVQIALDLLGCLLLAGFVRRIAPAAAEPRRCAGDAVAGGAVPVYRLVHRRAADRDADAVCAGAGAVGDGAIPRRAGVGECALVYFAVTCATLLRPDGALAAMAFAPALVHWFPARRRDEARFRRARLGAHGRWFAFCWRWLRLRFGRRATGASFTCLSRWRRGWPPIPAKARIPDGNAG